MGKLVFIQKAAMVCLVGFFLFTDDFWRDYHKMIGRKINFIRPPAEFEYGTVAVFEDLYGNKWDLIQPNE